MEYEIEQQDQPDEEQQDKFVYADYIGVIGMLQGYYFRCLELYRKHYANKLKGIQDINLIVELQSYILTMTLLFKHYNSIQKSPKILGMINKFDIFAVRDSKLISDKDIKDMIDALVEGNFVLGLSDIEMRKKNPKKAVKGG